MRAARVPWPQRTTAFAGAALTVGALSALLPPLLLRFDAPSTWWLGRGAGQVVLAVGAAAAFWASAAGLRGEVDLAGGRRLGRVALAVYGCRYGEPLLATLPPVDPAGMSAIDWIQVVLVPLLVTAGIVAAVSVLRASVLGGPARWLLLVVAVLDAAITAFGYVPAEALLLLVAAWDLGLAPVVALLALGVALLLHGRVQALRHRARSALDAW